ncbi:MAG: IS21 family transposase [Verrucomicrobia bacterium]|nr:IS21 family transposase [Verrucomicrobiota bacterium]
MIDYTSWCEIRRLAESGLSVPRIADAMGLNPKTVLKWSRIETFRPRAAPKRPSKLDPYKPQILRMVEKHPYTAQQILREVRKQGYTGGRSILQEYIAKVRPVKHKAYATLAFAPGECAQVDWGHAGSVRVGNTRRQLSFFVMTLGYSRMMYVEFTLSQQMEYFLAAHRNAFEFFGGVPDKVMVDNLKSAVLEHPRGGAPVYHPRYLDLASHYGFEPRACNVRAPHEKGIVERAVAYVRASFLNGLEPETFGPLNPQARLWLDEVANLREHKDLGERPADRFEAERKALSPLPACGYDVSVSRTITASSQFRVVLDTNRYSVPAEYAGRRLTMRAYPDRVLLYHEHQLIAEHPRSHQRREDVLNEDHQRALLVYRKNAREQQALARLMRLTPRAERFVQGLRDRRLRSRNHILKIAALIDIHGADAVRRAVEDAVDFEAYSSEYIVNLLEQRARPLDEPGPLHLTRNGDLLDLELPEPDITLYEQKDTDDE